MIYKLTDGFIIVDCSGLYILVTPTIAHDTRIVLSELTLD